MTNEQARAFCLEMVVRYGGYIEEAKAILDHNSDADDESRAYLAEAVAHLEAQQAEWQQRADEASA